MDDKDASKPSEGIAGEVKLNGPAILGALFSLFSTIANAAPRIIEGLRGFPFELLPEWKRRLEELSPETKRIMGVAAQRGWFLGWYYDLEEAFALVQQMGDLNEDQIDEYMASYYRTRFKELSSNLILALPNRALAIGAACRAHAHGSEDDYALAIPVFIAQGDGLLADILGEESPFGKARQRKGDEPPPTEFERETIATNLIRTRIQDADDLMILEPLLILHNLDYLKNAKERAALEASGIAFDALNRHEVMHGLVSDYGTELNSLKAFSVLCFVGLYVSQFADKIGPVTSQIPYPSTPKQ